MRTLLATLHSKFIHPSLALPCLAAYCRDGCGEIVIGEFTVHEPKENVLAALLAGNPDVVGFSVYLWNRRETLELADALAAARPGIRIVLGGPEVSFDGPRLLENHPGVTALIRGEGEIPLRGLLAAWSHGESAEGVPRLLLRTSAGIVEGPESLPLADLDDIPSPFELGLADISRGFVYLETSRGCPYSCAFCMSALDARVRTFSMTRIRRDLAWLIDRRVPKIKLVDRTFNYDADRAREIFSFILDRNQGSHFHFEIGAHLLDEATLALLERVPAGMFQFEIGIQSTLPATLEAVGRTPSLRRMEENVRRLRAMGNIHLHLDLIAGLPGEGYADFLASVNRVIALRPHHLQLEAVKLLPGSPLRQQAPALGIRFDPHPPYTVLATPELSFTDLDRLRALGRLLDLTYNSGRFLFFLEGLAEDCGSLAAGLERLEIFFRRGDLMRHPLSLRGLFEAVWGFIRENFERSERAGLRERLARDFALSERVVPGSVPDFFDTALEEEEKERLRELVLKETDAVRGKGTKIQHFAAVFQNLSRTEERSVLVFLYLTRAGQGMEIRELRL